MRTVLTISTSERPNPFDEFNFIFNTGDSITIPQKGEFIQGPNRRDYEVTARTFSYEAGEVIVNLHCKPFEG